MLLRALGTYPVGNGLPFVLQAFRAFFLVRTPSAYFDDVFGSEFETPFTGDQVPIVLRYVWIFDSARGFSDVYGIIAFVRTLDSGIMAHVLFHCSALTLAGRMGNYSSYVMEISSFTSPVQTRISLLSQSFHSSDISNF